MPDIDDLVTVARAGQLTGVSERQIRRWIAAGHLPATSGERGRLVNLEAVRRLAGHYAGPPDIDRQHDRQEPDTAAADFLAVIERQQQTIMELSGRCGFLQAEVLQLREQVKQLTAPAESPTSHNAITHNLAPEPVLTDQAPIETAQDTAQPTNGAGWPSQATPRPWWKRLGRWLAQPV